MTYVNQKYTVNLLTQVIVVMVVKELREMNAKAQAEQA